MEQQPMKILMTMFGLLTVYGSKYISLLYWNFSVNLSNLRIIRVKKFSDTESTFSVDGL